MPLISEISDSDVHIIHLYIFFEFSLLPILRVSVHRVEPLQDAKTDAPGNEQTEAADRTVWDWSLAGFHSSQRTGQLTVLLGPMAAAH